jgi:L-methionine (R)-S-oxide reductase
MQAVCTLMNEGLEDYNWVGFYLVDTDTGQHLLLGPYAGTHTVHTRIAFGHGVCGQVAHSQSTIIVDDVHAEDNYLACSLETKSEIVLPIFSHGKFVAILDVNSYRISRFDPDERLFLEEICMLFNDLL